MTLTERKRKAYPERYIRKDARTRIYRELYGMQDGQPGRKSNHPEVDETRRFNTFWSHQLAVQVFEDYIDAAMFTSAQRAELERRLDQLKQYKHY